MKLTLNGYVVADDDAFIYRWFGYGCFSPRNVRDGLSKLTDGEELTLEINSPGGSVFAGFEMYSALRSANVPTRAEVQSLAASAASVLMLGCDEVMLSPVAQVMIHLPSTVTDGDVKAHRDSIKILESITQSILNAYELKCAGKTDRATLLSLVRGSTWLSAGEAVTLGLADGVLYQSGEAPTILPGAITNAVGGGLRALADSSGGLPDIAELRARYRKLVDEGKAPPEALDGQAPQAAPPAMRADWRNSARIALCAAKL